MKIWKRGMALLAVLTLAIDTAACKKRTLKDAASWEDAVEICLGKYGVDVCEMEGDSLHVMIRNVDDG